MMACKGDDEMGRNCDANVSFRHEKRETRCTLHQTKASGSCRDYQLIPNTSISKHVTCSEHLSDCSSLDRVSLTMSPLQTFLLHLFKEKGIKDPHQNVRLIVDSGMIVMYEGKGAMPASQSDEITDDVFQECQPITGSKCRLVGWSGINEPVEATMEDGITSCISVFPVDSSNDQESLWHGSYRSIDMSSKDEVRPRTYESPTSIVDILEWDDIRMEKKDPHHLLLSVQPPHSSMSTLSGNS